jgi:CDP-glucose 4,6-dehydratase
MNRSFWKDRSVVLTGHTGFKGSWLSLWLQSSGARVTGYSLAPPTRPSLFEVARVARGMESVEGDVRDPRRLGEILSACRPEVVFHLAAQPLVRQSYRDPVETYATNVMGVVNILEAVRACPTVRAVVVVTTDKCYENKEWVWPYRENEPLGGRDPYSSSKACAEIVTAAYRESFFSGGQAGGRPLAVATGRAGNVIGGGDWAEDRIIPDFMRARAARRALQVRNPEAIRPWMHVLDPLHGYLLLAERLAEGRAEFAQGWNFGPGAEDAKPVRWIVDRLVKSFADGSRWEQDTGAHPHEAHTLKLDASKARRLLGWAPRLPLAEALDWIVEWHRALDRSSDMRGVTLNQIERYEERENP